MQSKQNLMSSDAITSNQESLTFCPKLLQMTVCLSIEVICILLRFAKIL